MIIVLGSVNMDLVVSVKRAPAGGETVSATGWFMNAGGKGANQAVQAALLGARVLFVGRVGSDAFGTELVTQMTSRGVDTTGIAVDAHEPTGVASIVVEEGGQNRIVIVPGANAAVGEDELEVLRRSIGAGDTLLLQGEVPFDTVRRAAAVGHGAGARVLLDPAPAASIDVSSGILADVDIVTPNETEAVALTGRDGIVAAAEAFLALGARTVIVKRGAEGIYVRGAIDVGNVPGFVVQAVDTTAAGDAFQGALATALDRAMDPVKALRYAQAAAALKVTRWGAQQGMPDEDDVQQFLAASGSVSG
jgi:ribokinase